MDGRRKLPDGVRPLDPDIRTMPDGEIGPYLRDWFGRSATAVNPDRAMILGTKARPRLAMLLYDGMPVWLGPSASVPLAANVAWFLAGLWTPDSVIPDDIVGLAAAALRRMVDAADVRDPLIMALGIAAGSGISEEAREQIRAAFSVVRQSIKAGALPEFAAAALNAVT